jgi:hypothetical protein
VYKVQEPPEPPAVVCHQSPKILPDELDEETHELSLPICPVVTTQPDKLAVAVQLDGCDSGGYDLWVDDVCFNRGESLVAVASQIAPTSFMALSRLDAGRNSLGMPRPSVSPTNGIPPAARQVVVDGNAVPLP